MASHTASYQKLSKNQNKDKRTNSYIFDKVTIWQYHKHICDTIHTAAFITQSKQYIYKVFKEKTKQIFIENVSAIAFTNSLLSTSHFSPMIHFKTNLQVIIYIIYINEPLNFLKNVIL